MNLTFEQSAAYFAKRLGLTKGITREKIMARCPFHGDRNESLSISVKDGVWKCFAGCGEGGLIDFEAQMFPARDRDTNWENIERIAGITREKRQPRDRGTLVASYDYHDADGKLVYQKQRYDPKSFLHRAMVGGKWVYSMAGVQKVLYHLPEVVRASVVFICEGEKDADTLRAIDFAPYPKWNEAHMVFAATTNSDGADNWNDAYAPYLSGKTALIMEDNDDAGRSRSSDVARSIARYAARIKIVSFPELPERQDVSDFLASHSVEALLEKIKVAPRWKAEEAAAVKEEKPFFVKPSLLREPKLDYDQWLVPGVIHKGGKGMIVAAPKAGKSMAALDLVVALADHGSWFGMRPCNRRVRSGFVSREDSAELAKARLRAFAAGRNVSMELLDEYTRFNTYDQRSSFSLQKEEDVADIVKWIKHDGLEFCIFDVLNYLHSADENSNTEMGKVMKVLDTIRLETDCQLTVIHHTSATVTAGAKRPRGAGAIDSWWDWKVSLSPTQENEDVKDVMFMTKAGKAQPPMQIVFEEITAGVTRIRPTVVKW